MFQTNKSWHRIISIILTTQIITGEYIAWTKIVLYHGAATALNRELFVNLFVYFFLSFISYTSLCSLKYSIYSEFESH